MNEHIEEITKNGRLKSAIECMLFVSPEPLPAAQMAAALETEESAIEKAVEELIEDLSDRGLQIVRVAGGYQMCTKPEFSSVCQRIMIRQNQKLSRAALETLAVIAYRQPVTQPEIEAIRGVNVSGVIKTLMDKGLIHEVGRKQTPGRPILYGTTPQFLEYMGLEDLSQLPDIDTLATNETEAEQKLFKEHEIVVQDDAQT
jgi:segregation and condensation protein B